MDGSEVWTVDLPPVKSSQIKSRRDETGYDIRNVYMLYVCIYYLCGDTLFLFALFMYKNVYDYVISMTTNPIVTSTLIYY